jgi:hypothetical protein
VASDAMPISSNSLIHFTSDLASLQGILEHNFKLFFCKESVILQDGITSAFIPMVSFCDIPLSQIVEHIEKYGNYGIGLTKEWGVKNGLNPVLYMSEGSMLSVEFKNSYNTSLKKLPMEDQRGFIEARRHIKNYQGDLIRKGKVIPKYRFYDEREWRFTPSIKDFDELLVSEKKYCASGMKEAYDKRMESLRLVFEPDDIKYIIIADDSEIKGVIRHLRDAKGKKFSLDQIEKLTTRIITVEQLKTDF